MRGLVDDVRHAVRALRRAPGFSAAAIATLGAGVGLTVAMFSIVYGVLFRPLPFAEPARLVQVWRTSVDGTRGNFAPGPFLDLRRESRGLAGLAAYFATPMAVDTSGEPIRAEGVEVTPNFFAVLGTAPARGRTFTEADDAPGSDSLVLADAAWRTTFGGDPAIVGRHVRVDGRPRTVVGVMPPGFAYPDGARLWVVAGRDVPVPPLAVTGELLTQRDVGYLDVVARLAAGVGPGEADAELRSVAAALATRFPASDTGKGFAVTTVQDTLVGDSRRTLLVLFGAVSAVLLIACTNLAGLLLARALGRHREFAVRTALGAPVLRLARQLVVESLLLTLAGGALALVVGSWTLDGLLTLLPTSVPRTAEIRLDGVAAAFAFAIAAALGLGFGLVPAWSAGRLDTADALRSGGRTATGGRHWPRRLLVGGQVTLAVVLLAGAGVMVKSLVALQRVDTGFRADGVVTQPIGLPQNRYDAAAQTRFYQAVMDRLERDPRIAAATVVFPTPLVNNQASATVRLDRPLPGDAPDHEYRVRLGSIGHQYFATLSIAFREGHDFAPTDFDERAHAIIVNEALARQLFSGGSAIGRGIRFGDSAEDMYHVIGVVADVIAVKLDQQAEPVAYLPFTHLTLPFMRLMARGPGGEAVTRAALVGAVRAEAPDLALDPAEPLTAVVGAAAAEPRFRARLAGAFAIAAVALAALGLYSLLSFSVASRTRELATRLALGATPAALHATVLRDGLSLTGAGLLAGLVVAAALGRAVDGLLFQTSATDPGVALGLVAVMAVVAAVSCYLPARRAMRVAPIAALHAE
ncbi:MAG: ABC transporter permease [Candidatus Binatia bacterium]